MWNPSWHNVAFLQRSSTIWPIHWAAYGVAGSRSPRWSSAALHRPATTNATDGRLTVIFPEVGRAGASRRTTGTPGGDRQRRTAGRCRTEVRLVVDSGGMARSPHIELLVLCPGPGHRNPETGSPACAHGSCRTHRSRSNQVNRTHGPGSEAAWRCGGPARHGAKDPRPASSTQGLPGPPQLARGGRCRPSPGRGGTAASVVPSGRRSSKRPGGPVVCCMVQPPSWHR